MMRIKDDRQTPQRRRLATRSALAAAMGLVVLGGLVEPAFALQGGEDPALLPVLIDKRFGQGGRHQTTLFFTTSMVTKFTEARGLYLSYQYNFTDILGLELGGGFFFGGETSIAEAIRAQSGDEPRLTDLYGLQWMGQVDFVFVPIYGKMSFASEFDPAFDLFFLAGGGVAGVKRKIGVGEITTSESKIAPAFNIGGGFRFYFSKLLAVRLEIRDFLYPEPGPCTNCVPVAAGQEAPDKGGLTTSLHIQLGVQLAFGGDE